MIFFRHDWLNHPGAIVDTNTNNKTFIDIAADYKAIGVKNYYWPLALLDAGLSGIDPRDPTLSPDIKARIRVECERNPTYVIREVIRIPPRASAGDGFQFRANRGNMALFWTFWAGQDILLIQPRQTGKSVGADCIQAGCLVFWSNNTDHTMLTKDDPLRRANVHRIKALISRLPSYLNETDKKYDLDNQHEVTYHKRNNRYITGVARSSVAGADNLGRGLTTPVRQIDESPFFSNIKVTMDAAMPGGIAARQEAIENGNPYGTILTTTAGKLNSRDGEYVYGLLTGGCPWSERLMDSVNKDHFEKIVIKYSMGNKSIVSAVFSHRQLGYSDEWLFKTAKETGLAGEAADRDLLNIWTSGDALSPLDETARATILKTKRPAVETELFSGDYLFSWFVEKDKRPAANPGKTYILGLDTSEAIGRDHMSLSMLDPESGETIGSIACNETLLNRYTQFLLEFMCEFKNTVLIIERKSTAQPIIDTLLTMLPERGEDPFKRMYNRIVHEASGAMKEAFREIQTPLERRDQDLYIRYKRYFGFVTTGNSRHELYVNVFKRATTITAHCIYDVNLADELLGLVTRDERIDHSAGKHDDRVISWLMAHWLLMNGLNLDYYGINPARVLMIKQTSIVEQLTAAERYRQSELERAKALVEELSTMLDLTEDPIQQEIIKTRLKVLSRKIPEDNTLLESIDAILKSSAKRKDDVYKHGNISIRFRH